MTKKKHEECQAERRVVGLCPTGRFHTIFKRQIQLFQGQWRAVEYLQRIMTWIQFFQRSGVQQMNLCDPGVG